MAVGIMSFSCSLRHKELPSASVRKPLSFASFRRRSLSSSRAICCRAQNVAAARWKFSPAGPSNWRMITVNVIYKCTGKSGYSSKPRHPESSYTMYQRSNFCTKYSKVASMHAWPFLSIVSKVSVVKYFYLHTRFMNVFSTSNYI
jgi:hypothetical protein